ncbi:MAG: hypothetical protein ABL865_01885, partial [Candidatus Nitrotoga sp.]
GEGNNHSRRHLSCIPFRKAECAAMRDLIRGSLAYPNSTNGLSGFNSHPRTFEFLKVGKKGACGSSKNNDFTEALY